MRPTAEEVRVEDRILKSFHGSAIQCAICRKWINEGATVYFLCYAAKRKSEYYGDVREKWIEEYVHYECIGEWDNTHTHKGGTA